jgi:predicted ATP-dependent protease
MASKQLDPEQLRWQPDGSLPEDCSTRKAPRKIGVVGQPRAQVALRFAFGSQGRNHNAFVRGPEGSGRGTLVRTMLSELKQPPDRSSDFCYVHNFGNPDRPRLIILPGGQGHHFQHAMTRVSLFVRDRLPEILKNDPIRSRREARKEAAEREIRLKVAPLEKKLTADGLALIRTQSGPSSRISLYPLVMGKPVSPEEFRNLVTQGQAREADRQKATDKIQKWQGEVNKAANEIGQIWQQALQHIDQINASETARILSELTAEVARKFKAAGMDLFLREIIDDIVEKRIGRDTSHLADPTLLYGVNVLTSRADRQHAPIVHVSQPSVASMFGTIDPAWMSSGRAITSFRGIRTGALLEADGGFLVLDAADVLAEPGSWRMLMRALRTGLAEVVPPELGWPYSAQSLKPEPIPIKVRVILIGDADTHARLMREDRDFRHLFKVLVDFDHTIARDDEGCNSYLRFLAGLVERDRLLHFDRSGVLAMIEQGARQAGEPDRLSGAFGELADLAREASSRAAEEGAEEVLRKHVEQAARQQRERIALPNAKLLRSINGGRLELPVRGRADGRIISATISSDSHPVRAFPVSISAVAAAARETRATIDQQPDGDWISLMLSQVLRLDQPVNRLMRITTRPAPEQTDSGLNLARGVALLAALANAPVRQGIAVVGDLDDRGQILPTNAINERIEAFYELCRQAGLSGNQAIIIPRANAGELMLDRELVKSCANDMFKVHVAEHLAQALELSCGARAGLWKENSYPEDSLLGRARRALSPATDGQP